MKTSVVGFPRIGRMRELKFACEKYFRHELSAEELDQTARDLRLAHWTTQRDADIDLIPSNAFSFYDTTLDTAALFGLVPERYRALELSPLDMYFAMARGYQGSAGDVHALPMKKWFNTNYHYNVPEIDDAADIALVGTKPLDEYLEAKAAGIETKPVVLGPFTLLNLANFTGSRQLADVAEPLARAYADLLSRLADAGAAWVQFDEPWLVRDLEAQDTALSRSFTPSSLPPVASPAFYCRRTSATSATATPTCARSTSTALASTSSRVCRRPSLSPKTVSPPTRRSSPAS